MDLSRVEFIASNALAVLVDVHERASAEGRTFAAVAATRVVRRPLQVIGLDTTLPVYDLDHALGAVHASAVQRPIAVVPSRQRLHVPRHNPWWNSRHCVASKGPRPGTPLTRRRHGMLAVALLILDDVSNPARLPVGGLRPPAGRARPSTARRAARSVAVRPAAGESCPTGLHRAPPQAAVLIP